MSYLCEQIPVLHISGQLDQDGALRWESLSGNTFCGSKFRQNHQVFHIFLNILKRLPSYPKALADTTLVVSIFNFEVGID